MFQYSGKTALITGASMGIGESFARQLAAKGMHLVLVARSEDKLKALASELATKHGIKTEVIAADLSQPGATRRIYETTTAKNLHIDMLVNNAGFSTFGNFETIVPEKEQDEIMVNIAALVDLTHAYIPAMLEKGDGAVINVASIGSFLSLARQAVYTATKAFVLSFSEALFVEYQKRGVKVFALCPGGVATNFIDEINVDITIKLDTPDRVVKVGLKAFEGNKHFVIPGASNYFGAGVLPRILPRLTVAKIASSVAGNAMTPREAKKEAAVK